MAIVILDSDRKDELDDKHCSASDFIKQDVMELVGITLSGKPYSFKKERIFDLVNLIGGQLDDMWDAYNEYRCAYDVLSEDYDRLKAETSKQKAEEES